jgi:hypothetical protein
MKCRPGPHRTLVSPPSQPRIKPAPRARALASRAPNTPERQESGGSAGKPGAMSNHFTLKPRDAPFSRSPQKGEPDDFRIVGPNVAPDQVRGVAALALKRREARARSGRGAAPRRCRRRRRRRGRHQI